jgi:hypothetical protein
VDLRESETAPAWSDSPRPKSYLTIGPSAVFLLLRIRLYYLRSRTPQSLRFFESLRSPGFGWCKTDFSDSGIILTRSLAERTGCLPDFALCGFHDVPFGTMEIFTES